MYTIKWQVLVKVIQCKAWSSSRENTRCLKNSYSRICIVYKNLATELTYADIRNIRNVSFISRTSIYLPYRIQFYVGRIWRYEKRRKHFLYS